MARITEICIPVIPSLDKLSERSNDFISFTAKTLQHIESYVVPQYGDKGNDLCTDYSIEECLRQAEKYIKRYGRNSREGQQELDFLKAAHYIQLGYTKYLEKIENEKRD